MAKLSTLKTKVKPISTSAVSTPVVKRDRSSKAKRDRERILKRDNYLCVMCSQAGRVTAATQVDHITPIAVGGSDADINKQSLCDQCHKVKTKEDMRQMR